ncbi:hypothetical protein T310_2895 [Rasamsonia emersonii CBS 393.64]|uniref:Uncharacterized protein n=1 Tax=Rasamsonia emersonii (strain ATCC 16479 / CBS 393.64 / IMI 116815) TaxID=1408163 RepID=A0A0F4YYU7_RASE3|nr:hypothetical protein T310_2895 [Rasamsonia emersonii CBS 393.64]KKA23016.1 hypothetical protein T310_2895 [Rasamsonia emersonii CBS 393.64]
MGPNDDGQSDFGPLKMEISFSVMSCTETCVIGQICLLSISMQRAEGPEHLLWALLYTPIGSLGIKGKLYYLIKVTVSGYDESGKKKNDLGLEPNPT